MFFRSAQHQNSSGFTLVELIVVMTIIALVVGASTPYLLGTLERQRLTKERDKIVAELKQAQQKSRVAQNGESYGISFVSPGFYLLLPENKQISYQYGIQLNSTADLVFFRKLTGQLELSPQETNPPGSDLTLELQSNRFTTQIRINSYGVLDTTVPQPL